MNLTQLWFLLGLLFSLAYIFVLILKVVPSLALDRFSIRMVEARGRLEDLEAGRLHQFEAAEVARLDDLVQTMVEVGAPSLSFLIPAPAYRRRLKKSGREVPSSPSREIVQSTPECVHRVEIDNVERLIMRETLRCSIMGSKFWWAAWPMWVTVRWALADNAAPIIESSVSVHAERTVFGAVALRAATPGPVPQAA